MFFTLHLFHPVFLRRLAGGMLEELAEEAYVGEVEGVSYFGHLPATVFQHHLRVSDDGAVDPFFRRSGA